MPDVRPRQLYLQFAVPHTRVWAVTSVREANGETTLSLTRDDGARRRIVTSGDVLRLDGSELLAMTGVCRVCGCTPNQACQGGCWWLAPDVCDSHVARAA